jgi:hypothetical protein
LVVVHLDELIEVDTVQIKDTAKVVPENKIVSQFDNSLNIVRVTLFQKE